MRFVSTLISSLVFTSAVFEHSKLFAHAGMVLEPGNWAGVRVRDRDGTVMDPERIGLTSITGTVQAPRISGQPGETVFIGVALTSDTCPGDKDEISIAVGVLAGIGYDRNRRSHYSGAVQFYPHNMFLMSANPEYPIAEGDSLTFFISSTTGAGATVSIKNQSRERSWTYLEHINFAGTTHYRICRRYGDWRVGAVKRNGEPVNVPKLYNGEVAITNAEASGTIANLVIKPGSQRAGLPSQVVSMVYLVSSGPPIVAIRPLVPSSRRPADINFKQIRYIPTGGI